MKKRKKETLPRCMCMLAIWREWERENERARGGSIRLLMWTMCIIYLLLSLRLIFEMHTQNVTIIASFIVDRCRGESRCGFFSSFSLLRRFCCSFAVSTPTIGCTKKDSMSIQTINKLKTMNFIFFRKLIKHLCLFALPDNVL